MGGREPLEALDGEVVQSAYGTPPLEADMHGLCYLIR
jgi:hypothetical protein